MLQMQNRIDEVIHEPLAICGGPMANPDVTQQDDLFHWPIVTSEDEQAVVAVLRAGTMSNWDITTTFEAEFCDYLGVKYALGFCNGTSSLQAGMWAVGLQRGDEMICPSLTYWASALQVFSLGATVVFADIDPQTLCIDAGDIERHISDRTKAIMVVHYCGHPADMDAILRIARKHRLKVIEDVSHAHGALYRGRPTGTFGDVAGMSMMTAKSFAVGEGGMLVTNDRQVYERAIAFSCYERAKQELSPGELRSVAAADEFITALPMGGTKGRMNQTCAAMGQVQLKHYPKRMAQIQQAMNRFWDMLKGAPGIRPHRAPPRSASTMGGWYNPVGHYAPEELGGLPVERFIEAVASEGGRPGRGVNMPLHLHPVFNQADVYGDGQPTRIAFSERDLRQPHGSLPHTEAVGRRAFGVPWFKHDRPESIARYAAAYRKVALQAEKLL